MSKIIGVIGGGAAGMMAAATIAESASDNFRIILWDKNNELGKKVVISGGGRCNVTTGIDDIQEIICRYPRGNSFLRSSFAQFPPSMVREWFESHNVPLKTEEDMRVFPISNNGKDIVRVFENIFEKFRVDIRLSANVIKIVLEKNKFIITDVTGLTTEVDRLIIAVGGQAYRHTGSTGDGYVFAEQLGHTITSLAPSLNSFVTQEKWPERLAGVSFSWAGISAHGQDKKYTYEGPFIFTHKGISGPGVFALSSLVAFEEYGPTHPLSIFLNLIPHKSRAALDDEIKRIIKNNPLRQFKYILATYIPKSVVMILSEQCNIDIEKNCAEVGKSEIVKVIEWMTHLPLHVVGRGVGDEFVTAGGVELSEVNPSTMESKKCHGLYFAGEILNIDGFTGGFNLQASWATGRLAGLSIVKNI